MWHWEKIKNNKLKIKNEIMNTQSFHFIEKCPPRIQLEMYMALLVEIGGSVQVRKNQFSQYWIPRIKEELDNELLNIEYIKEKIRTIKN